MDCAWKQHTAQPNLGKPPILHTLEKVGTELELPISPIWTGILASIGIATSSADTRITNLPVTG